MKLVDELRELYRSQQYIQALSLYDQNPNFPSPEWHLYGSLSAMRLHQYAAAGQAIERTARMRIRDVELKIKVRFQRGFIARHRGDTRLAITELTRALKAFSGFQGCRHCSGVQSCTIEP